MTSQSVQWRDRFLAGGLMTFCLFVIIAAAVTLFLFATVDRRTEEALQQHSGSRRSFNTITYWNEHGYFASGGLINLVVKPGVANSRAFYRSSTGAYMLSGYLVEKIAILLTGRYQWKLLAFHNALLMALTASLIALMSYRILIDTNTERRQAVVLAAATEIVFLTFPDVLAQYWELAPHAAAVLFAVLFLLFDHLRMREASPLFAVAQFASAFCVAYVEFIFGLFFLLSYCAIVLLTEASPQRLRDLAFKTALPAAAALLLFYAQLSWVRVRYRETPSAGSQFMFRTGLDGSTEYYHGHLDILFGRDVARRNFPANRESLFRWPSLFIAGALAAIFVIGASARRAGPQPMLLVLLSLIGGYAFYAALFSQAVVIHPYYYDILIATPLIIALFAFFPAILETRFHPNGVVVLITILVAFWYAMVQIRDYAMWYPMPK
jgi:hypothetical protein